MTEYLHPLHSLKEGHWFKLICGASFQHLPAVRTLALTYALAGADCIDVAADPAIVATAREGLAIAHTLSDEARHRGFHASSPWLMVSLNDGEDPHFRKAEFIASECPTDCPQPCEQVCPAQAIRFSHYSGVIDELCYGCGRCIPICPNQQISTRSYIYTPEVISPILRQAGIDAIEIHTQVGRFEDFKRLWSAIAPWVHQLKLVAISCPDGEDLIDYLQALHDLISPLPCALIWQTDGRPMSGDIGDGATRACLKLGQKVLAANLPGYVQLAGGTNQSTVPKLETLNLLHNRNSTFVSKSIAGIAYGSYARSLLLPILNQLEVLEMQPSTLPPNAMRTPSDSQFPVRIETTPALLWQAVAIADALVSQIKPSQVYSSPIR
ncbi:MAG: 4Fe-4S ferredoxin [Myxacorys chilensis ATA2-1-KO14]|nr:4Fe-4S ferredoxin [Myxacorys chilensis ATA2-1-KO14]